MQSSGDAGCGVLLLPTSLGDCPQLGLAAAFFMLCCAKLCVPGCIVLTELRLENYAVIDNLVVEFGRG